ncbi:sulfotransferase family protein [Myxosarcina sp. GI1(2024)]
MNEKTRLVSNASKVKRGERLIFVAGAPRSGTTLVQNMINSHPNICGGPEFLFLREIINLRKKIHQNIERKILSELCSLEEADRIICSLIESFFLPLAERNNCQFYSEKTPENILVFPDLIELFPASYFIYVVRDPRATVSSLLQVGNRYREKKISGGKYTRDLQSAIEHTKNCLEFGFTSVKTTPEKILVLLYENLVTDPKSETQKICDFIGIEWSKQMLNPEQFNHIGEKAITKNGIWYERKTFNRNPSSKEIDKWKNLLTSNQKMRLFLAFRNNEELKGLGYKITNEELLLVNQIIGYIEHILDNKKVQIKSWLKSKLLSLSQSTY